MADTPIYKQLAGEHLLDLPASAEVHGVRYGGAVDWPWPPPSEPPARTASEQDHTDPWRFAGADAGPPGEA